MEVTNVPSPAAPGFAPALPLVEGRDYYFDQRRFVLTEAFLLRRGNCCGNGCRHCPYRMASNRT